MFNLVIVEDNVATLEVLSKRIPWESQGINLIGTFADGTEAYDFCLLEKPDVLLTDVEMYGMNGLELSDKLLALYPDLELVFISAYNDFSYVRGALRMGAYDYVLKPLDYGQVIKTVVNALDNLKKKRADTRVIKEQVLLKYLTRSFNPHDSSSPPFPAELPLPDMPACCMVFKWHDTRSRLLPNVDFTQTVRQYLRIILNGSKPLMTEIPGRMVIIILPLDRPDYPAPEELALMLRKRGLAQFREKLWVGIGLSKSNRENLPESFSEGLDACFQGFNRGENQIVYAREDKGEHRDYTLSVHRILELIDLAEEGDWDGLNSALDRLSKELISGDINRESMIGLMSSFVFHINLLTEQRHNRKVIEDQDLNHTIEKLNGCSTRKEMVLLIIQPLREKFDKLCQSLLNSHARMIEQINQDIETHLNNPNLSVSFLAEKAGYTPAYLGQLYKRFGSRSLTDKINEERINRAAQILRSTTKTLSEVAAEVGIVNESYFSTLFKKYKGISPGRFGK